MSSVIKVSGVLTLSQTRQTLSDHRQSDKEDQTSFSKKRIIIMENNAKQQQEEEEGKQHDPALLVVGCSNVNISASNNTSTPECISIIMSLMEKSSAPAVCSSSCCGDVGNAIFIYKDILNYMCATGSERWSYEQFSEYHELIADMHAGRKEWGLAYESLRRSLHCAAQCTASFSNLDMCSNILHKIAYSSTKLRDYDRANAALKIRHYIHQGMGMPKCPKRDLFVIHIMLDIGRGYFEKDDFVNAAIVYTKSLLKLRELSSRDLLAEANVCSFLAQIHLRLGRPVNALIAAKTAVANKKQVLGENHKYVAEELLNLASVHYHLKNFDQALSSLSNCLKIACSCSDVNSDSITSVLIDMSSICGTIDDYDSSKKYLRAALENVRSKSIPNHKKIAELLQRIAVAHHYLGELGEAVECAKQAEEIMKHSQPPKMLEEAW